MKNPPKIMDKKEIEKKMFRAACLNPTLEGSPIPTSSMHHPDGTVEHYYTFYGRICAHGTGMTLKEINDNIIWKGKPYIKIPYCKYCYTEDTVGIFDDEPQLLGWVMFTPDEEELTFRLEKMEQENFEKWLKDRKLR